MNAFEQAVADQILTGVRFRTEQLFARRVIPRGLERMLSAPLTASAARDFITDELVITLAAAIPVRDGIPLRVPADWAEHFKERWFPRWALRRWPIRYATYDPRAYYPDIPRVQGRNFVAWVPEFGQPLFDRGA